MRTARRKALTDIDRAEWAAYARHVAALPGHALPPGAVAEPVPPVVTPPGEPPRVPVSARPGASRKLIAVGEHPGGLDNASWNRLRAGKLSPTRTLDLHGRTAQRAYHALHVFLEQAHADHVRCVEVITGRGSGEAGGVIRRELPMWLNLPALRPLVLAATHPHAANPGSVRLLLRRIR